MFEIGWSVFIVGVTKALDFVQHSIAGGKACPRLPHFMVFVVMTPLNRRNLFANSLVSMTAECTCTTELVVKSSISPRRRAQELIRASKAMDVMSSSVTNT